MSPEDQNADPGGARGGIDGWREVWEKGLLPSRRRPLLDAFSSLISVFYRLGVGRVQRSFNLAVLEMMEDRQRDITDLRRDFEQIADDIRRLEKIAPIAVERNDALFVVLDQKIESALSRLRDLSLPAVDRPTRTNEVARQTDWQYRRLEEALRGSSSELRASLEPLLEYLEGNAPVADVGCGRGELLELCRDNGIEARGFDVNERSVAEIREKGLKADVAALPGCLETLERESLGLVVAIHVIEHLPADVFMGFFTEAFSVLKPGGFLILETPNAKSMAVTANEFWRDPTHLAPRHEGAIVSLAREAGFSVERIEQVHPWDEGQRLSISDDASLDLRTVVDRLNEILFAPQDLRVILKAAK